MIRSNYVFGVWVAVAILTGGILSSFHQPFRPPDTRILQIADEPGIRGWRVIHVLSGSCGCSQRIMRHLLARQLLDGATEQVVIVDGEEPYLDGSNDLMKQLTGKGFILTHRLSQDIPEQLGLRGVPLLILATPDGNIAYVGGYGKHEDEDVPVYRQVRAGEHVASLPVVGCAIGKRLRRSADPFHLKY